MQQRWLESRVLNCVKGRAAGDSPSASRTNSWKAGRRHGRPRVDAAIHVEIIDPPYPQPEFRQANKVQACAKFKCRRNALRSVKPSACGGRSTKVVLPVRVHNLIGSNTDKADMFIRDSPMEREVRHRGERRPKRRKRPLPIKADAGLTAHSGSGQNSPGIRGLGRTVKDATHRFAADPWQVPGEHKDVHPSVFERPRRRRPTARGLGTPSTMTRSPRSATPG